MNKKTIWTLAAWALLLLGGCSNEKEIDIDLPEYEPQMVVECYLEPGKPYTLLLQQSVSYFDEPSLPFVEDALVVISHNGQSDTLKEDFYFDSQTGKLANYVSEEGLMPADFGGQFDLYIRDPAGRELRGSTVLLDTVALRPVELTADEEGEYAATVRWPDFGGVPSFYRFTIHRESPFTDPDIVFTLDDRVGDGDDFVISTFFYMDPGDSVYTTVYHIEEAYWRYITTTDDAESSNGNPFAQPGLILSNVEGGIGIFTCLSKSRSFVVVP